MPPGVAAALLGMSLVLLNFGLDELGNPRLRDGGRRKIRGRALAAVGSDAGRARGARVSGSGQTAVGTSARG